MARVTTETVEHVARLAKLSLTSEECLTFARQLDAILAYAESIQALETSRIEPMSHAVTSEIFRDDTARPGLPRDAVLAQAPDSAEALFRVPRVIAG